MAGYPAIFISRVMMKILIVQDELMISEYVLESMLCYNLVAEVAGSIHIAYSLCLINGYDSIIFCSANNTSLEWIRSLRTQGIDIPIIGFSFIDGIYDFLESFVDAIDAYVVAPYDIDQLYLKIYEAVSLNKVGEKDYSLSPTLL